MICKRCGRGQHRCKCGGSVKPVRKADGGMVYTQGQKRNWSGGSGDMQKRWSRRYGDLDSWRTAMQTKLTRLQGRLSEFQNDPNRLARLNSRIERIQGWLANPPTFRQRGTRPPTTGTTTTTTTGSSGSGKNYSRDRDDDDDDWKDRKKSSTTATPMAIKVNPVAHSSAGSPFVNTPAFQMPVVPPVSQASFNIGKLPGMKKGGYVSDRMKRPPRRKK